MAAGAPDHPTLLAGLPRLGPGSDAASLTIAQWARAESAQRILEVGCGHGATARALAQESRGLVVASDRNLTCVRRTRETLAAPTGAAGRAAVCAADLRQLPFAPDTFDAVVAEGCLYLVGLRRSLGLVRPILRKGGSFVFTHFGWTRTRVPTPLRTFWEKGLPERFVRGEAYLVLLEHEGFRAVHLEPFPRREWEAYYDALRTRLAELDGAAPADGAEEVIAALREEIRLFETGGLDFYAYFLIVGEKV